MADGGEHSSGARNLPHSDQIIGVSSEQRLTVSGPRQRDAISGSCFTTQADNFGFQLIHDGFRFQIPDLNGWTSRGAEPVSVWTEGESVDYVGSFERVQMFTLIEVPEHGFTVFTTGSAQRTVRRHGDGVDVPTMAVVIGLQLAVGEVPNFDHLIPTTRHDDWVLCVGREPHVRHPLCVAFFLDGVFALTKGVPQLDGVVTSS